MPCEFIEFERITLERVNQEDNTVYDFKAVGPK